MEEREVQLFISALDYKIQCNRPDIYEGYRINDQPFTDQTLYDRLRTDPGFALQVLEPVVPKVLEELLAIMYLRLEIEPVDGLDVFLAHRYQQDGLSGWIKQVERILPQGTQTPITTFESTHPDIVRIGKAQFKELRDYILGKSTSSPFQEDICSAYFGTLQSTYGILTPTAQARFKELGDTLAAHIRPVDHKRKDRKTKH